MGELESPMCNPSLKLAEKDRSIWETPVANIDSSNVHESVMPSMSNSQEHASVSMTETPEERSTEDFLIDNGRADQQNSIIEPLSDLPLGAGVCGLRNLGNTCFMNAGLQCLINMPAICQHFFQNTDLPKHTENDVYLVSPFRDILFAAWSNQESKLHPSCFKNLLGTKYNQFAGFRQQDCQEFLALLLSSLHDELNTKQDLKNNTIGAASQIIEEEDDMQPAADEDEIRVIEHQSYDDSSAVAPVLPNTKESNRCRMASGGKKPNEECLDDEYRQQGSPSSVMKKMKLEDGEIVGIIDCNGNSRVSHVQKDGDVNESKSDLYMDTTSSIKAGLRCIEEELGAVGGGLEKREIRNAVHADADKVWKDYISDNRSVIAETFQGQFKNTIQCSSCEHLSITYEPFMYLPVPLPGAFDRQIEVVFVPQEVDKVRRRYLVTVSKHGTVGDLRAALMQVLASRDSDFSKGELLIGAGSMCTLDRVLDDSNKLTYVKSGGSDVVYAHELKSASPAATANSEEGTREETMATDEEHGEASEVQHDERSNVEVSKWLSCKICMEDFFDTEINVHSVCGVTLCNDCLSMSITHHQQSPCALVEASQTAAFAFTPSGDGASGSAVTGCEPPPEPKFLQCPVCMSRVDSKEFEPVRKNNDGAARESRILMLTIMYRYEIVNSEDTRVETKTFDQPRLTYIKENLSANELYDYVMRNLVPSIVANSDLASEMSLHRTDSKGLRCSQCYSMNCKCSLIVKSPDIFTFKPGDSIAVSFKMSGDESVGTLQALFPLTVDDESTGSRKSDRELTIHDCIKAFTEGEILEVESNPWFCPMCRENREATKQISIWRLPNTLVIYLKRFYFHNYTSQKIDSVVECPLQLDMSSYLLNPEMENMAQYSLQSCVCHFGNLNAGHYTAFAKNPVNNNWYYFNDDSVSMREPCPTDYKDIYILFYQREDCVYEFSIPEDLPVSLSRISEQPTQAPQSDAYTESSSFSFSERSPDQVITPTVGAAPDGENTAPTVADGASVSVPESEVQMDS